MSIEMDTADEHSEEEHEMTDMVNQPLDKRNKYKLRYCDYCEIQVLGLTLKNLTAKIITPFYLGY